MYTHTLKDQEQELRNLLHVDHLLWGSETLPSREISNNMLLGIYLVLSLFHHHGEISKKGDLTILNKKLYSFGTNNDTYHFRLLFLSEIHYLFIHSFMYSYIDSPFDLLENP